MVWSLGGASRTSADTIPDGASSEEDDERIQRQIMQAGRTEAMIGLVQHPNNLRGDHGGVSNAVKTVYLKDDVLSPSSGGYFL